MNRIKRWVIPTIFLVFLSSCNTSEAGDVNGTGIPVSFNNPAGIVIDKAGNIYVADTNNSTIRKITPAGMVTTLAGKAGVVGNADGIGSVARFNQPQGVASDSASNVYVADTYNHTIRKITPAGVVTTFAGAPLQESAADVARVRAYFNYPTGVAIDSAGNIYVADGNNTIVKISSVGVVTTLAGTAGWIGSADGTGAAARFQNAKGIATNRAGDIYVADTYNDTIRKITPAGVVTTLAGTAVEGGSSDGTGTAARFSLPVGVATDRAGNVFVADTNNNTIRKITPSGVVTTFAGISQVRSYLLGDSYVTEAPLGGYADGTGAAARFYRPTGIAIDSADNIYVTDTVNNVIRKITPAGVVTTVAGKAGVAGHADSAGAKASLK